MGRGETVGMLLAGKPACDTPAEVILSLALMHGQQGASAEMTTMQTAVLTAGLPLDQLGGSERSVVAAGAGDRH